MSILESIILGIIQGLTEFLPVSSSAHLNIFPWLFKWSEMPPSFDFALHIGTLFALLIYFFKDWVMLISSGYKLVVKKEKTADGRLFWFIFAATIAAGVLGAFLENVTDKVFEDNADLEMIIIACALIVMGIVLYLVDRFAPQKTSYKKLGFKQTFLVGFSQALAAAIPGVSRSGITMTVARGYGIDRVSAARLSFLLSAPIIGGGALISLVKEDFVFNAAFFSGVLASFIVGLVVIKFLLGFLQKRGYAAFAIYRIIFGLFIIIVALAR